MSLRINTNVEAINTHRQLTNTQSALSKSMERLSSGYRINRAADDAAGLGISEKMRSQIRGLAQAQRNIQDGISMVQVAESNLDEVHSMLQRVRELAVQYKNGSFAASDKAAIQNEVTQLGSEIERIGSSAQFNGIGLLNATSVVSFQVGANDHQEISVGMVSLGATISSGTAGTNFDLASPVDILTSLDASISAISTLRSTFGASQNRLEHALSAVATYQENLTAAESRIRDVDMAEEMTNLTKQQILSQAGSAMLAQANQSNQSVLSLLRG
jgi:flagellin